ncbi:MAG: hypothetical protein JXB45_04930, partial [Candidatus Krumholzibacteriota bacterium]|nr:hypothetical protein [Candidatus Krumholzibacteriota bacterium]
IEIDSASRRRENGAHRVFAYLSRPKLVQVLSGEYSDIAAVFHGHLSSLPSLRNDLPAYTASYLGAGKSINRLASLACEIQAVSGAPYPPFASDRESMGEVEADRLRILSGLDIAVKVESSEELDSGEIAEAVRSALASLGVGTSGSDCTGKAWLLRLEPRVKWKRVIGRICELTLKGELRRCDDGLVLTELSISDPALRGEGRNPAAMLQRRIIPQVLSPLLHSSLSHVIPLEYVAKAEK